MKKLGLLVLTLATVCSLTFTTGCTTVPGYKDCKYASCWDGSNAQKRMMNILSPAFSDSKFKEYVKWMKDRGCNTAHVIFINQGDGEGAGYNVVNSIKLTKDRIKYIRKQGLAVVPWIITDDSSAYAKTLFKDPDGYIKTLADAGVFDEASYIVLGLEMNEYGSAKDWNNLCVAVRKYCPKKKIGVHHVSSSYTYAALGDIVLDQCEPKNATPAKVASQINKIKSMGKEAVGFEYARQPNRSLAQAALDAGAIGVGNW